MEMLTVAEAEALISSLVAGLMDQAGGDRSQQIALGATFGRVLAEPITSPLDFPHWDNSAMDGYAVRQADVASASAVQPITLPVVMEISAGQVPGRSLHSGEAARIFTGAMLPPGADSVVMQENCVSIENSPPGNSPSGASVQILEAPALGNFVRHRGSFHRAGALLLEPGLRLAAPELAVLAAAQVARLRVWPQVQVGLLSTGDELVAVDQPLGPGQIVDSNRYALGAAVRAAGAIAHPLGCIPDQRAALKQAIAQAQTNPTLDVVLSTGGVSVGDYDYVDAILAELGATLHIRAIAVKPGKPLTIATLPRPSAAQPVPPLLYCGLPGNPVSALVSFWRFIQPALMQLSGLSQWQPQFVGATCQTLLRGSGDRETYLWGRLQWTNGGYQFSPASGSHSSGNLVNLAGTNGLARLPVGTKQVVSGDPIDVMVLP